MDDNEYVSKLRLKWSSCDQVLSFMRKELPLEQHVYDYYTGICNDQETCKWIEAFIAPISSVSCSIDNKYALKTKELAKLRVDIANLLERLDNTFDPCSGNSKGRLSHGDMIEVCHDLYETTESMICIIRETVDCANNPDNNDDPLMTLVKLQIQSAKLFISKYFTKGTPGFVTKRIADVISCI